MSQMIYGVLAALIGGFLLIPDTNLSVGWSEFFFMGVAGTIMGVTAGAVAVRQERRR